MILNERHIKVLFEVIYNSICSCTPNVIFNIFGFRKVIYLLSCSITITIVWLSVCITTYIAVYALLEREYLLNAFSVFLDLLWRVVSSMFDNTMLTNLVNIHTYTKPTKITIIHDFPMQQRPRHRPTRMWAPGGRTTTIRYHGFSAIYHPSRLCNRNSSLLLGYLPCIDTELHWHKRFNTRINDLLFEFNGHAYPVQPNHLSIFTRVVVYNL